ncbi:MAG: hypothetical protein Q8P68_00940 [Candidatus Peregrinibacteria bacterium]|nr:hypothetical protein [Candidatus Peregrinibacteria bacterium]
MSKTIHNSFDTSPKDTFSDFFYNAPKEEKISVFTKAAKEANRDQRELVKKANLKLKNS